MGFLKEGDVEILGIFSEILSACPRCHGILLVILMTFYRLKTSMGELNIPSGYSVVLEKQLVIVIRLTFYWKAILILGPEVGELIMQWRKG